MASKIKQALMSSIIFYRDNFYLFTSLIAVNILIFVLTRYIPYVNWFLDVVPIFLTIINLLVLFAIFRPTSKSLFYFFIFTLAVISIFRIIDLQKASSMLGIVALVLVMIMVVREIKKFRDEIHTKV